MAELDSGPMSARPDPAWPRWLGAVLVVYAVLAVIYSIATPIFEPPDEVTHFPMVDRIARTGRLPVQDVDTPGPWFQEGSQPPLYYALSALIVLPVDRGNLPDLLDRNPHAKIGIGLAADNHVSTLHDWDAEAFPWRDTPLAVHLARFFSIALSLGTIVCIYHIARLAIPGHPALHRTAVLLAAFNPMFLFISASVNNDNLVNLLSAAVLALLLIIWRGGLTERRLWALAILLALAALSKLSGLALVPLAALVVTLVVSRDRLPFRRLLEAGIVIAGVWIVVAGWWYARNWHLYGDPTGTNRMVAIIGPRDHAPSLSDLAGEFEGFRLSFWGVFGTLNVVAPGPLYRYADVICLLALVGLIVVAVRAARADDRANALPLIVLALHALIVFVALVAWTRRTPATQGRLLYPALGPLVTLAALGLWSLVPRPGWRRFLPLVAAPMALAAAILPFTTIQPTYTPPPTVTALPGGAIPVEARFGPIDLLGVTVRADPVRPGGEMTITLYWRPLDHTDRDMSFYVQVFGQDVGGEPQEIGKLDSYPGRGLLRTTTWDLGVIYADSYRIAIDDHARAPVQPRLKIGWRDFDTGTEFEPVQFNGEPRGPIVIEAGRIVGDSQALAGGQESGAVFGGALRLNRSRIAPDTLAPGGTVTVSLEWEALAPVGEDFTILVHLVDPAQPDQPPLATGDSPPLAGRWPTSAWVPENAFLDAHTLVIPPDTPPGSYRVAVGFYRPADFSRLPVETKHATLPGAVILPQTVTVEAP